MYIHFFKRVIDLIFSLIALPFVLLIIIIIAPFVWLDDRGPIVYAGKRIGLNGKPFGMLKFRSMKMNAADIRNADGSTYNADSDERQTRIGRFLRQTSLDELPQLVNVLAGDMSLIGPRPSPMGNEATYTAFIKKKFQVRPGITGYNQALKRNSATMEERYQNDVYYAEHVSFILDVKILLMTISSVLLRKNIYHT